MSAILSACGGGDGSNEASGLTTYKAIDGYLGNAEVYADRNSDNIGTSDELLGTTNSDGTIQIEQSDTQYPIIIKIVANQTIDSDTGILTESKELIAPAGTSVITPFTTVAYLNDMDISSLAEELGVTEDSISGDFIENGNTDAHAMARSIYKVLDSSIISSNATDITIQAKVITTYVTNNPDIDWENTNLVLDDNNSPSTETVQVQNQDSDSSADSDSDTATDSDSDTATDSDSDTATDSDSDTATDSDSDTATDSDSDTATDSDSDTATDSDSDTATDSDSDTATDSDSDTATDSDSDTATDSDSDTTTDSGWTITPWSVTDVASKMAAVSIINTYTDTNDLCETGSNHTVVETEDFAVTFGDEVSNYSVTELETTARIIQVALDELIEQTGLSKSDDLNISSSDKWTGCYNDSTTGDGEGKIRRFIFSPASIDSSSDDFENGYILAKHELFHVIQAALLNENEIYNHIPRWFQESSAELFAGRDASELNPLTITDFMADSGVTPYYITSCSTDIGYTVCPSDSDTTSTIYESDMYNMYQVSLEYLISKGLTKDLLLQLIRDSYSDSSDGVSFPQFNSAMSTLETSLDLPVTFSDLRDNVSDYTTYIISGLMENAYSSSYADDIDDVVKDLIIMSSSEDDVEVKGRVNDSQDTYTLASPLSDGTYKIYAITQETDEVYGPVTQSVTSGALGPISFSGIGLCTESACTEDD